MDSELIKAICIAAYIIIGIFTYFFIVKGKEMVEDRIDEYMVSGLWPFLYILFIYWRIDNLVKKSKN